MDTLPRRTAAVVAVLLTGATLLGAGPPAARIMPAAVNLGAAANFAILAGAGVTDTGPSVISGDVGTHPLPTISDRLNSAASGRVYRAGVKSQEAQQDLARALAATASLRADGAVRLSDQRALPPGVYTVADGAQGIAGAILDGQDAASPVWIFVVRGDLMTAPGSAIALLNGAQACNVFWVVDGSATLASESTFAGSVLATTAVTVGSNVTIAGRLLARTGPVSLAGDTISVPACVANPANQAPRPGAGTLVAITSSRDAGIVKTSDLPPFLPIMMLALLVAAAALAESADRRPRRTVRRPARHGAVMLTEVADSSEPEGNGGDGPGS